MDLAKTVIIYDSIGYFKSLIERHYGIRVFASFKKVNLVERILRKASFEADMFSRFWYGEWKDTLSTAESVIIFATKRYDYIKYIAKNFSHLRIIVWYWNPVYRCFPPSELHGYDIEFWSFDKNDCKNFSLKYNSTFYFKEILAEKSKKEWDLLFLGANKGRRACLQQLELRLKREGLKTNFIIVPDKGERNPKNIKSINYLDYLHLIGQSDGIVDFIQEGQAGLTLRPMESLFLRKKLITNDASIEGEPFFDNNNILILGQQESPSISNFMRIPYKVLPRTIVEHYDFPNWLARFDTHE